MAFNTYKQDEETYEMSKAQVIKRLFSYMFKYKKTIVAVLLLMGYGVAIGTLNPLFIEIAIDKHIANGDIKGLCILGAAVLALNVIMIFAVKLRMYLMAKISNKMIMEIRQELFEKIQTLDFHFFDSRPTGKILSRIIGDVNSLKSILENSITTLIPEFITVIAVIVIMVVKNARLALAALWSLPLLIVMLSFIETKCHALWQVHKKKSSNMSAFIHEDLSGMRVVQTYTAEGELTEEFQRVTEEHRKSFMDAVVFADAFGSVTNVCRYLGTVALYFVGIKFLGIENVSIGTYIAFGSYIGMFWQPISNLSSFYNQFVTNLAAAERIFEVMDTQPQIKNALNARELPPISGAVTFDNVSFSYNPEVRVLNKISFDVKPGETIALVGPTGAGKTTIVNLVSRFYDTTEGSVKIDGYDVKDITIESLRKQMGVMTQDTYLFSGTIKENIKYGKLDATDEEIYAAAKAVHADSFIENLPDKYDTVLSERGGGLSNGQRQLIAFARTMISMPKILILDEATSSIDTKTELIVQKGIEALLKGRTSFVIAHRLSTIKNADRIFVIDAEGIKEQGTPEQLMEKKGEYYKLYMAQFADIA